MTDICQEVTLYALAKKLDPEPLFDPNHDRSYPDKASCEWFSEGDSGELMRQRVLELLKGKEGYAVQTCDNDGGSVLSYTQLPVHNFTSDEPIPNFIGEYSEGWIRIGNEFWEWTGDNAVCYLCKMNVLLPSNKGDSIGPDKKVL